MKIIRVLGNKDTDVSDVPTSIDNSSWRYPRDVSRLDCHMHGPELIVL